VETGLRDLCRQLLVKVVANEIDSGFIFLEVAWRAYLSADGAHGYAALSKAEAIYAQARELADGSEGWGGEKWPPQVASRLGQLRTAIDSLVLVGGAVFELAAGIRSSLPDCKEGWRTKTSSKYVS
jgi:hypothetical protein